MISATGEYALRAAVFLARHHPHPITSACIAEGTRVPSGYLSKVLHEMVRGELILSQRGMHGGFTLVREPVLISVLDVLRAVDAGPVRITKCPLGFSHHVELCAVHRLLDEALGHAERAFASSNLEELSRTTLGIVPLCDTGSGACLPPPTDKPPTKGKEEMR